MSSQSKETSVSAHYKWHKVPGDNGALDYFWNPETGEVKWDEPDDYVTLESPDALAIPDEGEGRAQNYILWAELTDDEGLIYYQNIDDPAIIRYDKPVGQILIVCEEDGIEVDYRAESGSEECYINMRTGERTNTRPNGTTVIEEQI
jgi:hypothetical protein